VQRQANLLSHSERGFTLIEVLVATSLSVLLFGAIVTVLIGYQRDAQRSTLQNDAQDQARIGVDRIVRELRNVASSRTSPTLIEAAGSYDLVFQTVRAPSGSNAAGISRVRYCLPPDPSPGSGATEVLMVQTETWTTSTVPANPWTTGTACPYTPGSLPSGASVSSRRLASNVMNRYAGAARPAFSYYPSASSLSTITSIGIDLFVDAKANLPPAETELRSSAFLRNQNQTPIASFTATSTGGGHVLLNGGGSSDPDGQTITFAWFKVTGSPTSPCSASQSGCTLIGSTGLFDWRPGATGTYTVELVVTDPGGLTAYQRQSVVVT
jgi:prepilin-type N-terminal cleavage/methylation domain-containing protein